LTPKNIAAAMATRSITENIAPMAAENAVQKKIQQSTSIKVNKTSFTVKPYTSLRLLEFGAKVW